ncbi:MAG TPA: TolC family protein [Gemmatimonadaceae bacterium]|nr:TolC family protein [Gemmatimonadaceae bacterium]
MPFKKLPGRIAGFGRLIQTPLLLLAVLAPAIAGAQVVTSPTVPIAGTAPRPLTLPEAIRIAEVQSENIRIARAGVERAHGQQYQARSQFFPQIGGTASYTRTLASQFSSVGGAPAVDTTKPTPPPAPCDQYLRDPTATTDERLAGLEDANRCALGGNPFSSFGSLGFGAKNQYNLGLSFAQSLFAGGRIVAQNEVANAGKRAADIELTAQNAQLRLDITQAYFDAALQDRLVALAESSAVQTDKVLAQTQLARNVGNVSEFDVLRAQVSSANQRPIVIRRRADRESAYLLLKQLLNMPLDATLELTTVVDDSAATNAALASIGVETDTVAANRATVRQGAEAIAVQRGLLRVAKGQRLPTIALTSQYGKVAFPLNTLPGSGDFRTNWTVGVAAAIPLFTGGRLKGDQLVAEANLHEAKARYDQLREFAALDARVTINDLLEARAAWEASQGTASQAARAYSIAEVRYREGLSTQLELNDSRILLEQSVANRALAARNLQVARVKLALLPNLPLLRNNASQAQASAQSLTQPTSAPATQSQTTLSGAQAAAASGQAQAQPGIPTP